MKVIFQRDTAVDVLDKYDDFYFKNFKTGEVVELKESPEQSTWDSNFINLALTNGEVLLDVKRSNVTILK